MRYSYIISFTFTFLSVALGAPVDTSDSETIKLPAEAIIGYLDFGSEKDIEYLPISNGTSNGVLFVNTTIANAAAAESGTTLSKRDADAWHWVQLGNGQPMYKRDAEADAWHWVQLGNGQPMYKRDAEADAWHWVQLGNGQPMYKRDAEADAWHWVQLSNGQPMY